VGIAFGLITDNILQVMMWIVGALYGGYVMANVLKWYWWRFNGHGYFWGMLLGMVGAMAAPKYMPVITPPMVGFANWLMRAFTERQMNAAEISSVVESNAIYTIPVLILLSLVGCLLGTFLGDPEDEAVLKHFYRTTRPWGVWGPIRARVMAEDPTFVPNGAFVRDSMNVVVGIAWQLCLTSLPIFLVLRSWTWFGGVLVLLVATSVFIKLNWYDKLPEKDQAPASA
jgi:hypothetical protein